MNTLWNRAVGLMLVALLGAGLAQSGGAISLRQAFINAKALVTMTAPKPLALNGFKQSYSYGLTLRDVYTQAGVASFGLVLASRSGTVADTISFSFSGPYSQIQAATANTLQLLFSAATCLGVPPAQLKALNQPGEFLNVLLQAFGSRRSTSFSKRYSGVNFTLSNVDFSGGAAGYTILLSNPGQVGQGGWKNYCTVRN